jgi:hypothetical protein
MATLDLGGGLGGTKKGVEGVSESTASAMKVALAAILWTIALLLGLVGTVDSDPRIRFWALMVAMPAALVSGHLVMCQCERAERICIERLVDGMVARARDRADAEVPRIPHRN